MVNDKEFNIEIDGKALALLGFDKWYTRDTNNILKDLILLTKTKVEGDHITLLYHFIDNENGESKQLLDDIKRVMEFKHKKTVITMSMDDVIRNESGTCIIERDNKIFKLETKEVK